MIYLIKKNEIYQAEVVATASSGDGICRIDNLAVFVENACEGDFLEIKITNVKSSYANAEILCIITPSDYRKEPECPVFNRCGGCQLMHIDYKKQLELKKQFVFDSLTRLGHLDLSEAEFFDTIGMEKPERYRNKMVFPIGKKADGRLTGGFYAAKSHNIIALSDCLLGDKFASDCLSAVISYMKENNVSAYDEAAHKGLVRRLFVRTGLYSHEAMAVISINGKSLPNEKKLVDKLLNIESGELNLASIIININDSKNNLVLGAQNRTLFGKKSIYDILCGLDFEVSPNSFYQVNPMQTEKLYNTAIDFAELKGSQTVLDLYCGIGTISLCAAKKAARVIGVEIVEQAIKNAEENAKRNGIKNAEFYTGSAEDISQKLLDKGLSPDVIFIDPPRKGSDEVTLNAILNMSPEKIVYVSCNPATLARDLKYLTAGGYALKKIQPVDMFPNTVHVECCVLLCR
ncbi:MAG: 23S rRNA (uracil(1939)-C(5))-methyltransferase RlmD [Clostridia bacterium]|nr:23S rRNA (uracil(1939)-C(5))-methyltransferase RlmD [Clostridia bacterium]